MGARFRIFLTREQDQTLLNLRTADVPHKVKDRAEVIRLNAHGWYVEKIAAHFNSTAQTVTEVLHKWRKQGLDSLWELAGRGGKAKGAFLNGLRIVVIDGSSFDVLNSEENARVFGYEAVVLGHKQRFPRSD